MACYGEYDCSWLFVNQHNDAPFITVSEGVINISYENIHKR